MINKLNNTISKISFGTANDSLGKNRYGYSCTNFTCMFRDDIDWNKLTDYIVKEDKPKKIYCYACSDGSEPYSLAIALISRLGYKKAQKYFPIIARDIDSDNIREAYSNTIKFEKEDFPKIRGYCNVEKYFTYKDKLYTEPIANRLYYVKKELSDCVDFGIGDIVEDSASIKYDNSIVLLRNALFYMPDDQVRTIIDNFRKNFKDSTALVIGSLDCIPFLQKMLQKIPKYNRIPVYTNTSMNN